MEALKIVRAKYVRALVSALGREKVEEAMGDPKFLGCLNCMCHEEANGRRLAPEVAARVLGMMVLAHLGMFEPMS